MSPTSYQAAPPRFMTIADAGGCVKLPHLRGNGAAVSHSLQTAILAPSRKAHHVVARNAAAHHPYNADAWLLWPSIDKSGGSPQLRNPAGNPLPRARTAWSFSKKPPTRGHTIV